MSVLIKERDYDDVESIRTSRTNGRGVRTIRRYRYPADDYDNDVNEEVDRIIIREKIRRHSPERHTERTEIDRHDRSRERDRDWDRESAHSARSHHTHRTQRTSHSHHHHDDVEQIRITEKVRAPDAPADVQREISITAQRPARSHRSRSSSSSSSSSSGPSTHTTKTVLVEKDMEVTTRARSPETVPYTLERYARSTSDIRPDHHHHHQTPMPIIIRSEAAPAPQPIIIRENSSPREIVIRQELIQPQQQLVPRAREEDRQVARRDDDYYYEKHVRRERPGRYREEEKSRRSRRDRNDWSDDEVEHRRRRRVTSYSRSRSRSSDSHHKRNVLTGVVGGVVAGELIRHNRKKQGEAPGSRLANIAGYGALGGVGAEAVTRLRHWEHERSRSRSHSRHRSRSRARSKSRNWGPIRVRSLSRGETLIAGAAGLAAIGAAAYAARNRKTTEVVQNTTVIEDGGSTQRGRSHHRDHVVDSVEPEHLVHDAKHRNQRMAQAGVVGAALSALAGSRSRSRKGNRGRSKSRLREGLPIVAAALGSAGVAGIWEKHKANQEEKRIGSRSRSVSHARSRSAGPSSRHIEDDVEYGDGDIYSDDRDEHYRAHSRSRSRGRKSSSSPDTRHRSRSRSRNLGTAALAAGAVGAAGLAAHEAAKRREERRAERERRRAEAAGLASQSSPSLANYSETTSTGNYYPSTNQFAPPPAHVSSMPGYADPVSATQQQFAPPPISRAYNPADYGPTIGPTLPADDPRYAPQSEPYAVPLARDVRDRSRSRSRHRDDYRPGPANI